LHSQGYSKVVVEVVNNTLEEIKEEKEEVDSDVGGGNQEIYGIILLFNSILFVLFLTFNKIVLYYVFDKFSDGIPPLYRSRRPGLPCRRPGRVVRADLAQRHVGRAEKDRSVVD
jgi:hypothetical protein